jgi:hypothetical protein
VVTTSPSLCRVRPPKQLLSVLSAADRRRLDDLLRRLLGGLEDAGG